MKLYTYQEELLKSKADKIVINWCRGAGKEFAIARYIIEKDINKVAVLWSSNAKSLVNVFKELSNQYNFEVESLLENKLIKIKFTQSNRVIELHTLSSSQIELEDYDLVVGASYEKIKCKKHIVPKTRNIHEKYIEKYSDEYLFHTVDYKAAMAENALDIERLIQDNINDTESFYREYALKDKYIKKEMDFRDFTKEALKRLQNQFLNIADSKDTVLTRKNIIEMIKDLKEMSRLK